MSDVTVFQASYFGFEMGNIEVGYFTACSGIGFEWEVVEHKAISPAGQRSNFKSPGRQSFSEVVFKRGYTGDLAINKWFESAVDAAGPLDRQDGSIVLYSRDFTEVGRFNLFGCLPSKLSVTDLSATSTEPMVEELTVKHNRLEWAP